MSFTSISILPVIICAVVNLFIGFLWYGPIFGKPWQKVMNLKKKDLEQMQKGAMKAMILSFIGSLVLATVLSIILANLAITEIVTALLVALIIWLGFEMVTRLNTVLYEKVPFKLFLIDTTFDLVVILVMTLILMMW